MIQVFFQDPRVNRLFILPFENEDDRDSHSNYYLPKVKIKNYNVMIDVKKRFDKQVNNDDDDNFETYKNSRKIATGKGCNYTTGYLLDCPYFK